MVDGIRLEQVRARLRRAEELGISLGLASAATDL